MADPSQDDDPVVTLRRSELYALYRAINDTQSAILNLASAELHHKASEETEYKSELTQFLARMEEAENAIDTIRKRFIKLRSEGSE